MAALLPLAPIVCAMIAGSWHYLRHYSTTFTRAVRTVRALKDAQVIARNFARNLELALTQPNLTHRIEGTCTHCGRCCLNSDCVFLSWTAGGASNCSIHKNWFWKLTSCGSYPVNAQSIAVYDCPSFKAVPIRFVSTRAKPHETV